MYTNHYQSKHSAKNQIVSQTQTLTESYSVMIQFFIAKSEEYIYVCHHVTNDSHSSIHEFIITEFIS